MRVGIVRSKLQGLHIMDDRSIDVLLGHERVPEDNICVRFIRLNLQGFFALSD